jgi:hypothetical protein
VAGPFTIQRVPRGVLELLGLRGSGDLPHEMAQEIRATLDIGPFYGFDLLKTPSQLTASVANGWNIAHTVPPGELWVPTNISAEFSSGVGAAAFLCLGYKRLQDNTGPNRSFGQSVTLGASAIAQMGVSFNFGQLILASGDTVGARASGVAATVSSFVVIDYYKLLF